MDLESQNILLTLKKILNISGKNNIDINNNLKSDLNFDQQKFEELRTELENTFSILIDKNYVNLESLPSVYTLCNYLIANFGSVYLSDKRNNKNNFYLEKITIPIYQNSKDFLDCIASLICYFIGCYKLPYHWLLSDVWGFYYEKSDHFYVSYKFLPKNLWNVELSMIWKNISKVYNMKVTKYSDIPLKHILKETISRENCLFTVVDGYYIPWIPFYQNTHSDHAILIIDYNEDLNMVRVIDIWPNHFNGWLELDTVEKIYLKSFELTVPTLDLSDELLLSQIESCYEKIIGSEENEKYSGIIGLEAFKRYLDTVGDEIINYIDYLWDTMKYIINAREGFLEFLFYLHNGNYPNANSLVKAETLELLEHTIKTWYVFKRKLLKQKITNNIHVEGNKAQLNQIIQLEKQFSEHISLMILQFKEHIYSNSQIIKRS